MKTSSIVLILVLVIHGASLAFAFGGSESGGGSSGGGSSSSPLVSRGNRTVVEEHTFRIYMAFLANSSERRRVRVKVHLGNVKTRDNRIKTYRLRGYTPVSDEKLGSVQIGLPYSISVRNWSDERTKSTSSVIEWERTYTFDVRVRAQIPGLSGVPIGGSFVQTFLKSFRYTLSTFRGDRL